MNSSVIFNVQSPWAGSPRCRDEPNRNRSSTSQHRESEGASTDVAPEGDTSSTFRLRNSAALKVVSISTCSTNSMALVRVTEVVTVDSSSVMARSVSDDVTVSEIIVGALLHPTASCTAARASTTPNPYRWLNQ